MEWVEGKERPERAATSRISREEDDAPIPICSTCGEREAAAAFIGAPDQPETWRTGTGIPSPSDWPLSVEELLAEDEVRYRMGRAADVKQVRFDELED